MQYLLAMDVIDCQAQLHKPLHNFSFSKEFAFLFLPLDVVGQVAVLAELHDDYEHAALLEGVLVGHDVRVI